MAPSIEQIISGQATAPAHLVETLGALCLWAMAEPGRTLHVSEVYGRIRSNRAVKVTVTEGDGSPRTWQVDVAQPLAEHVDHFLLDLVNA